MDTTDTYYDIPITNALDEFVEAARNENQRPASIANRKTFATTSLALFAGLGISTTGQITLPVSNRLIRAYKGRRNPHSGAENGDSATRSYSLRYKTWCGWAYQMRYLRSDQFYGVKLWRADDDSDVPVWSDDDLGLAIKCIHNFWDPALHPEIAIVPSRLEAAMLEARAIAWLSLALSTGARRGEMCALRQQDIDRKAMTITFRHTKGRRSRDLPLSANVAAALDDMAAAREALTAAAHPKKRGPKPIAPVKPKVKGDWLFRNCWGEQIDGASTLRQFKRYFAWGRAQGMPLPERFTLHGIRHKAISSALQINPEHARQLAGHTMITTTQKIYGHTSTDDVRETHKASDVLDRIMPATAPPPPVKPRAPKRQRSY